MRRRIGSALALWALVGLGQAGCATQSRRAEAPLQFRQWTKPSGASTASAKAPTSSPSTSTPPSPAPDLISSMLGRSAASPAPDAGSSPKDRAAGATGTRAVASDIPDNAIRPRPRPSSWLFRRFNKPAAPPTMAPPSDPSGSLARFFPTLYGKGPADSARLAQVSRTQGTGLGAGGRSMTLSGASIEMTRNTMASASDGPPLLADGIHVRAYPKAPSPSLPASESLVDRDRPAREARSSGEQLTSHESEAPEPTAPRKPDLIDALSTRLESDPPPAAKPNPDDAPSDPNNRATSATVEVPAPRPDETERPAIVPLLNVELNSAPPSPPTTSSVPAAPKPAEVPSPPEPKRPDFRPAAFPALDGQPRPVLAPSAELPEPEFPATYHTESLRQVAREAPRPSNARAIAIEPAPRKPLMPRLSRLLWGPAPAEAK